MARGTLPGVIAATFLATADEPASYAAPSIATDIGNVNAVDLIGPDNGEGLAEMNGWIVNASTIPTPDYRSHTVGNVPGDSTVQDSSMSFYYDRTDTTIYDTLVAGTTGVIILMRDGATAAEESQLWPVTVVTRFRRPARDQAHIFDVNFSVGTPTEGTLAA